MSTIEKQSAPVASVLSEGDRITISATHQFRIDSGDSWVKLEVNSAVRPNEDADAAVDRVGALIASKIIAEVERQAGVVVEFNESQRKRR